MYQQTQYCENNHSNHLWDCINGQVWGSDNGVAHYALGTMNTLETYNNNELYTA